MKTRFLFLFIIVLLLISCRPQEPVSQLKEINETLTRTSSIIEDNNRLIYEDANNKLVDPRTKDKALIWQPKMQIIMRRASESKLLIDYLRAILIKQSDSLKKSDYEIVDRSLETNGIGSKLFGKLVLFKDSSTSVFDTKQFIDNPFMIDVLRRDSKWFYKSDSMFNISDNSESEWFNRNFANCSPLMALLVLNKIEAKVISSENFLISYCNYHIVDNYCGYNHFAGVTSISSNNVKAGDTVVVTAGVGAFTDMMCPRIFIAGSPIKLNRDKVAVYRFTATGKPGMHTIPVKMEFMGPNGSRETRSKDLKYTITENK